jgi:hypothetical protein
VTQRQEQRTRVYMYICMYLVILVPGECRLAHVRIPKLVLRQGLSSNIEFDQANNCIFCKARSCQYYCMSSRKSTTHVFLHTQIVHNTGMDSCGKTWLATMMVSPVKECTQACRHAVHIGHSHITPVTALHL